MLICCMVQDDEICSCYCRAGPCPFLGYYRCSAGQRLRWRFGILHQRAALRGRNLCCRSVLTYPHNIRKSIRSYQICYWLASEHCSGLPCVPHDIYQFHKTNILQGAQRKAYHSGLTRPLFAANSGCGVSLTCATGLVCVADTCVLDFGGNGDPSMQLLSSRSIINIFSIFEKLISIINKG